MMLLPIIGVVSSRGGRYTILVPVCGLKLVENFRPSKSNDTTGMLLDCFIDAMNDLASWIWQSVPYQVENYYRARHEPRHTSDNIQIGECINFAHKM